MTIDVVERRSAVRNIICRVAAEMPTKVWPKTLVRSRPCEGCLTYLHPDDRHRIALGAAKVYLCYQCCLLLSGTEILGAWRSDREWSW